MESDRVGLALAQAIGRAGRSQPWVADRCGVSATRVRQWISGERRAPASLFGVLKDAAPDFFAVFHSIYLEERGEERKSGRSPEASALLVSAVLGEAVAHIARSLADGRLDDAEKQELARLMTKAGMMTPEFAVDVRKKAGGQ